MFPRLIRPLLLSATLTALFTAQAETVFHRGNDAEPSTMDPQLAQGMPEMHILRDLFVGLVDEDADATLIPGVAERWDISEDGRTYTFHLRDSQWSDGTPVTAEDFVYAWQRAVDPETGSQYSFFLYPIKGARAINDGEAAPEALAVTATDDHTLMVELENPTPYFLDMLVNAVTYPVPKAVVEKHGTQWTRPEHIVSNGAFVMSDWQPQAQLTLSKSSHYYDADAVTLDKVIYYPTEDQNGALQRYRAGELDFTSDVPNEKLKWIRANLPDELHTHNFLGTYYFGFNLTKPPFQDNLALREALTLAVEREPIVTHIAASGEPPAYSFVVPGVAGYTPYQPAYAELPWDARLKKAKEKYADAGYNAENPLKVELLYNTNDNNKKIAIAVAAMWKQALGVETELVNKEWKSYLNDRKTYQTQVFRGSWIGDYNDPNTFLDLFVSNSGSNTIGLSDPHYDELIALAAEEADPTARMQLFRDAEKRLLDNYSLIPVYFYVSKHMIKPYVSGYTDNVMNHWPSKYIRIAAH